MELFKEILAHALTTGEIRVIFSCNAPDLSELVESTSYKALQKIKAIIEDDSLEDSACFMKIEQIICTLEDLGISCGNRHDFG